MGKVIVKVEGLTWTQEISGCTLTITHKPCGEAYAFSHKELPGTLQETKSEHEARCPALHSAEAQEWWPDDRRDGTVPRV